VRRSVRPERGVNGSRDGDLVGFAYLLIGLMVIAYDKITGWLSIHG